MYSVIRAYKKRVTTVVVGACQSAAVLVFAAGDVRIAAKDSWFMVHEDSGKISGSVSELSAEVGSMLRKERQWAELMHQRTGAPIEQWDQLSKATSYLDASEMLELGLVHKYLEEKA
jgi:ATP-dependent protease ClpP protease subunit